jgi:hypothetical protein
MGWAIPPQKENHETAQDSARIDGPRRSRELPWDWLTSSDAYAGKGAGVGGGCSINFTDYYKLH